MEQERATMVIEWEEVVVLKAAVDNRRQSMVNVVFVLIDWRSLVTWGR